MTIMLSCDHHDDAGCVPDNRSRKHILQQFVTALGFGAAFLQMVRDSDLDIQVLADGQPLLAPTITIRMDRFLDAWLAFMLWHANAPRGDDLAPPHDPPSTTRIPEPDAV